MHLTPIPPPIRTRKPAPPNGGPELDLDACLEFIGACPNISVSYLKKVTDAAREKIKTLEQQQEKTWHKAEERMPPFLVPVLVFGTIASEKLPDVHEGYWNRYMFVSVRGEDHDHPEIKATHWREMPEPPKEQQP